MPYIEPEVIEQARQIDLLTYLQAFEPHELVRISGNNYTTRTHDSLKISNGKWMWWSRRIGGYNALDYLVKVKGCSFVEAVETLMGKAAVMPSLTVRPKQEEKPKVLLLPEKSASNDRITEYLFGRGIDYSIIGECIDRGLIFESLPYHNLVFVGFDEKQKPRYAAYRATGSRRILGDCSGSDKHYSFALPACGKNPAVHLCECAIDVMSYASLCRLDGIDWKQHNLLSLAGVYQPKKKIAESKLPVALTRFLEDYPHVKTVYLHLDNDGPGRMAAEAIQTVISKEYEVKNCPPPRGKDVNDYLCRRLGIPIRGAKGKEQER